MNKYELAKFNLDCSMRAYNAGDRKRARIYFKHVLWLGYGVYGEPGNETLYEDTWDKRGLRERIYDGAARLVWSDASRLTEEEAQKKHELGRFLIDLYYAMGHSKDAAISYLWSTPWSGLITPERVERLIARVEQEQWH